MKKLLLTLCLFTLSPITAAQETSLAGVVQYTLQHNPDILARQHALQAQMRERDAARGGYLPRVDLNLGSGKENLHDGQNKNFHHHFAALNLSQMLFDGFATRSEITRLDHAVQGKWQEFADTAANIALETSIAYSNVLRMRQRLQLAEENYQYYLSTREKIQAKVDSGLTRRVDLEQLKGRIALAQAGILDETTLLRDAQERYRRITGLQPAANMALPPLSETPLPPTPQAALHIALARHPAWLAVQHSVKAAQATLAVQKAAFSPRLDLRLRSTRDQNLNGTPGIRQDNAAEIVLSWNLFRGNADIATSRQYAQQINIAKDQRDKLCRELRQNLALSYNDIDKLKGQLQAYTEYRRGIEYARQAYYQQFEISQRTLLDVLNTENELYQAKRSHTNAQFDLFAAYARAHLAAGGLLQALQSAPAQAALPEIGGDAQAGGANCAGG